MKEININNMIKESGIINLLSYKFSQAMNLPEDKMRMYIEKKIEMKINEIGEQLSKGDMTPQEMNILRNLNDADLSDLNDKIIKDK